jgi:DNA primase
VPLFPQRFIEDLRLQANMLQVIQQYVPLKRVGAKYKGLCPFHSEKTPSFTVDPDKGFFKCFGCGAGGDVFKFLELHERLGFPDAVRMLAERAGMVIPEGTHREGDGAEQYDAKLRETILKAHEVAAAYFSEALAAPAGARARLLIEQRGISTRTSDALGLGFAPNTRQGLLTRLQTHGFERDAILKSGLVVEREGGELWDRFRSRLMVPISRDIGSVIAFGGRAMEADQVPKYLNSPETPIFSKSRVLYGLNLTKAAIRQLGYAVLVEGYFDFAQVYQAQVGPVVASCGTALTSQQVHLLRRFTRRVVLSYDPDTAGQNATARSCELLVSEGFDVNVVRLEPGEDPDTFIQRRGAEAYQSRLRQSRPYLDHLLDQASTGLDFGQDDQRREFLGKMLEVAARIPDAAARDQFADRLAHRARITEDVVRAEIRKAAAQRRTSVTSRDLGEAGGLKPAEKGLIWGVFHRTQEAAVAVAGLDGEDLDGLATREVLETVRTLCKESSGQLVPAGLLQRLNPLDAELVTRIAATDLPLATPSDCARALRRLRCEREREAIQRQIDRLQASGSVDDGREIDVLWQKKKDLLHRIEDLT